MSEVTKKSEKKEPKLSKQLIIGGVIALVLVIVIIIAVIVSGNKKPGDNNKPDKPVEEVKIKEYTEQELIDAYGFSIKDAEELVMSIYHSDNFECSTTIKDAKYIVTVKDVLSGDKTVYTVNPASHEYTRDK